MFRSCQLSRPSGLTGIGFGNTSALTLTSEQDDVKEGEMQNSHKWHKLLTIYAIINTSMICLCLSRELLKIPWSQHISVGSQFVKFAVSLLVQQLSVSYVQTYWPLFMSVNARQRCSTGFIWFYWIIQPCKQQNMNTISFGIEPNSCIINQLLFYKTITKQTMGAYSGTPQLRLILMKILS